MLQPMNSDNETHGCSADIVACTVKGRRFVCSNHAQPTDVKHLGAAVELKSNAGKKMYQLVSEVLNGNMIFQFLFIYFVIF